MSTRPTAFRRRLVALGAAALAGVVALPSSAHASVSNDSDFSVRVLGTVLDVAPTATGRTIIGGTFTGIGSQPRTGLGAVLASGYADTKFAPQLPAGSVVEAVETSADGSVVYVGGSFTSVNGVARSNLVALDAVTGAVIETWRADTDETVRDIEVAADRIYVAGSFTSIDGQARRRLAALTPAGDVILSFNARPDWTIRDIDVSPDLTKVYAVGGFTTIGGANRSNHAAELLASNGDATSFNPALKGGIAIASAISPDGRRFLFSTENNSVFAYAPAVSNQPVWVNKGGGDTQAIAVSTTGEVYIGGHFHRMNAVNGAHATGELASVRLSDGAVTGWRPDLIGDMGPWIIEIHGAKVVVGGDYSTAGGRQTGGFTRFSGTP